MKIEVKIITGVNGRIGRIRIMEEIGVQLEIITATITTAKITSKTTTITINNRTPIAATTTLTPTINLLATPTTTDTRIPNKKLLTTTWEASPAQKLIILLKKKVQVTVKLGIQLLKTLFMSGICQKP